MLNIGYIAKRTLIPTLMEWVSQSRIQPHIIPDARFITPYGDDGLHFSLETLSDAYIQKHIAPNLTAYALKLIEHISPTLILWCQKNNLQTVEMTFRFHTANNQYTVKRTIKAKKIDLEGRAYLENKST
jgi:hypothetical protein